MPELSRQGMIKATLAAIAAKEQPHWSQADMVRAAIEAYVAEVYPPKPWDSCTGIVLDRDHFGYCKTCRGMLVLNEGAVWVHPA